jgi:hypothetical protein
MKFGRDFINVIKTGAGVVKKTLHIPAVKSLIKTLCKFFPQVVEWFLQRVRFQRTWFPKNPKGRS